MPSDEEEHHEEETIRGVKHHVTPPEDPNEDVPTMAKRGKKQRKDCRIQDRAVEDSLVEFSTKTKCCGTHRRQSTGTRRRGN